MTEPATFVLNVDNPLRDLPGQVLLGAELCGRGHDVILAPVNMLADAWAGDPDFFVLNYHRTVNDYQVRRILERGLPYAVLDTEGAYPVLPHYKGVLSTNDALRDRASVVCLWGERLAAYLLEENLYRHDQVVVTGCPRFDFLHESLAESALSRSRDSLTGPDEFILIVVSAPVANPLLKTPEQELDDLIQTTDQGRDWYAGFQREQARSMQAAIESAGHLANRFPDMPIVIRPHPFENPAPYQALADAFSNVIFHREGALDGMLLRARCVIARSGTPPQEAAMAGKPCFSTHWVNLTYQHSRETDNVLHPCVSVEDLAEKVGSVLEGTYSAPAEIRERRDCTIRAQFHLPDGSAHIRVADALESAMARADRTRKKSLAGMRLYGWASKLARRTAVRAWRTSVKRFDIPDVRAILESFQPLQAPPGSRASAPVQISRPRLPLESCETFRCRALWMRPQD